MKKILITLLLSLFSFNAFAQSVNDKAVKEFVETIGNKIINIAGQKISESEKKKQIIAVVDGVIDADWISRFVLSKNYRLANDAQKEEFRRLYREFMINTYGPKFKNYNGRKFTVNQVSMQQSFYVAKAEFMPRDSNIAISVDFRVKEKDGKLVILDFIAEGVSLIETQRSEFNSAISQKGIAEFLKLLQEKVARLKQDNLK